MSFLNRRAHRPRRARQAQDSAALLAHSLLTPTLKFSARRANARKSAAMRWRCSEGGIATRGIRHAAPAAARMRILGSIWEGTGTSSRSMRLKRSVGRQRRRRTLAGPDRTLVCTTARQLVRGLGATVLRDLNRPRHRPCPQVAGAATKRAEARRCHHPAVIMSHKSAVR